jgi:hypothetical protein
MNNSQNILEQACAIARIDATGARLTTNNALKSRNRKRPPVTGRSRLLPASGARNAQDALRACLSARPVGMKAGKAVMGGILAA